MIKYENECCGCAAPAYPCLSDTCHNRHVPHYYCDNCNCEEQLYYYDGQELCLSCIENKLERVN